MKAILIIDMPTNCKNCDRVIRKGCTKGDYRKEKRPKGCPLKPMPNEACEILTKGLDAMEKMKSIEVRVVRRTE